ncbi:MAG: hypothetical protein KBI15_00830 [Candidatus Pacebacteria bacterium]|jgi:hypothetical protein|nr:hypothetical protein [Candidatus Paceibacterota bacterium]
MFIEDAILRAYAITIISEIIVILAIRRPTRIWQWVVAIFLINSITHPLTICLLRVYNIAYLPVEIGVFIIEMVWYKLVFKLNWKDSAIISGLANLCSIFSGRALRSILR